MSSKARKARMCRRKKAHPNRRAAEAHAQHLRAQAGAAWEAYHCRLADHWHVGRAKSTRGRPKTRGAM